IRALAVWDLRRRNGRFARVFLQVLWCQSGRPLDGPQRPRRSTIRVFLLRAAPSASARSQGHRPSLRALALTDRWQRRCPASIRDSRSTLLGYTAHAVKRVPRFLSASSVRSNVKLVVDRAMKRLGFLHLDVSGPLRWVKRERPHPWDRVFLSRSCCIVFDERVKGSLFGIAAPCDLSCIGSETYRNPCMSPLVGCGPRTGFVFVYIFKLSHLYAFGAGGIELAQVFGGEGAVAIGQVECLQYAGDEGGERPIVVFGLGDGAVAFGRVFQGDLRDFVG